MSKQCRSGYRLRGLALVGPLGPPTIDDPSPGFEPLLGALIIVEDVSRGEIQAAETSATGEVIFFLEPGTYCVSALRHPAVGSAPGAIRVEVLDSGTNEFQIIYDTGIR